MKAIAICIALSVAAYSSLAQVGDSTSIDQLDEVVFSANKFSEKKKNIAQRIDIVSSREIARVNAQNSGDLLMNTGNVFVQKSQQGGSSPVIRGFEASRVLLVVDGIRLNNAIYRSGHLQNVITVDQNMLDRVEILFGPSSTLFGSDALGGIVHFRTRQPQLKQGDTVVTGKAFTRFSSANKEKTIHADINIGLKQWAFLSSLTVSDFDDLKMGSNYPSKYPDFGRRTQYVARIQNSDTILRNGDDRVQKFSGYRQWDLLQKIIFQQTDRISHSLNVQISNSSNVPRYDRLQDIANGNLRFAEWYYGPQFRSLASYEYLHTKMDGLLSEVRFNVSHQRIKESRHQRNFRSSNLDNRQEGLDVFAFNLDGRKVKNNHELNVGLDGQFNSVKSEAYRLNILTREKTKIDSRYPDGENHMNYVGAYFQHVFKLIPGKLIMNDGARLQHVALKSNIDDTATQLHLPYKEISQANLAATANIGFVYLPSTTSKISLVIASGFRNPNIDDLSKIFESSTANRQLIVPNRDIKPEYTYNLDLSLENRLSRAFALSLNGFYTWFRNAIVVAPFQLNGQDSVLYNGVKSAVLASQNRNRAHLYGFTASVYGAVDEHFSYSGTLTLTKGRFETNPSEPSTIYQRQADGSYERVKANVSSKPLDHIPPVYGRAGFVYTRQAFNFEVYALFNGWKHLSEYNADGEDNPQYATPEGMPSWYTLNLRSQYTVTKSLYLQAGIENLLDRNYRTFASGFSAPGRNYWASLRVSF